MKAFEEGLRSLGYRVGENVAIEYRFADGEMGRLSELVTDLVGLGVEPQRRLASSCHQRF
jgi:putative ABC transport system substrate-binding protein